MHTQSLSLSRLVLHIVYAYNINYVRLIFEDDHFRTTEDHDKNYSRSGPLFYYKYRNTNTQSRSYNSPLLFRVRLNPIFVVDPHKHRWSHSEDQLFTLKQYYQRSHVTDISICLGGLFTLIKSPCMTRLFGVIRLYFFSFFTDKSGRNFMASLKMLIYSMTKMI